LRNGLFATAARDALYLGFFPVFGLRYYLLSLILSHTVYTLLKSDVDIRALRFIELVFKFAAAIIRI